HRRTHALSERSRIHRRALLACEHHADEVVGPGQAPGVRRKKSFGAASHGPLVDDSIAQSAEEHLAKLRTAEPSARARRFAPVPTYALIVRFTVTPRRAGPAGCRWRCRWPAARLRLARLGLVQQRLVRRLVRLRLPPAVAPSVHPWRSPPAPAAAPAR